MAAEVVASVISSVAVTIAAAVTAWMAVETRRTARATEQALELERRPVLGAQSVRVETVARQPKSSTGPSDELEVVAVRVGVELHNAGRVSVRYTAKDMNVSIPGHATSPADYVSRTGIILPGGTITFFHPMVKLDPTTKVFPVDGQVTCRFEYSDDDGNRARELEDSFRFAINRRVDGGLYTNWLHVDEQADQAAAKSVLPAAAHVNQDVGGGVEGHLG